MHLAAFSTTGEAGDEALKSLGQLALADDPLFAQVVRDRVPCVASDTETDPRVGSTRREVARARGYRSMLIVPMLHEGGVIGAITVTRREAGAFSDVQIGLLQTFAAQAVIAIENVRLFTELQEKNRALAEAHAHVTEALDQQTATSEILRTIAQAQTDVQPVFEAIAGQRNAAPRGVGHSGGPIRRRANQHGGRARRFAWKRRRRKSAAADAPPARLSPRAAVLTRTVQHVIDVETDLSCSPSSGTTPPRGASARSSRCRCSAAAIPSATSS